MNKEDYVSLEVAKLLKEKGYNIPCKSSRKKNGELIFYDIEQSIDNMLSIGDECYEYLCPTLYEAQKWLRENYILVNVYCLPKKLCGKTLWYYQITKDIFLRCPLL